MSGSNPDRRTWTDRLLGKLGPDRPMADRVGIFAAAAVVGPTFEPGLQPRGNVHQAVATGVVSALTLGTVTASQSAVDAFARIVTRDRVSTSDALVRYGLGIAINAGVAVAGLAAERAIPVRRDESFRRGLLRTAAHRLGVTGIMTTAFTGVVGLTELAASRGMPWMRKVPISLPAGVGIASWRIHQIRTRAQASGDTTIADVSPITSVALAVGVGAGALTLQIVERRVAHTAAWTLRAVAPRYEPLATPVGHLVALGGLTMGLIAGYEYISRRVEQGGAAVEPAYQEPPTSPLVSGGPGSVVSFESLSREGRRFSNMVLSTAEIEEVMGTPAVASPIRVFVGLAASPHLEDRIDLAMDELVRTGAFERSVLCLASPTGSGYINYVMAEAMEFYSLGDCATVTLQYSLLPSFLSLDRARLGVEQNRALMHAITGYLRGMPEDRRPRFVLFGESLGAQTLLDIYRHRTAEAIDRDYVSASLFLGTPAGCSFARSWHLDPERVDPGGEIAEIDNYADYLALPHRPRHVLLTHNDDPIPKFGPSLIVKEPEWLGDPDTRPPGVPRSTRWRPATTFVLTGIDLVNAMEVIPGEFSRRGHDYRADLPDIVNAVFGFDVDDEVRARVEQRLIQRELAWAEKRVITEQLARAKESVLRELNAWGVVGEDIDPNEVLTRLVVDAQAAVANATQAHDSTRAHDA